MKIQELIDTTKLDRLESKVLLGYILNLTRAQLITRYDYVLTEEELAIFAELVKKRQQHIPLAYLIGYKEFYSRKFKVTPATLIPRPETELLVDQVLMLAPLHAKILDLGTGSGCIAITCKLERPDLEIMASDKFTSALVVAADNAKQLKAEVQLVHSDWWQNIIRKFDLIVSNPPYIENNDSHLDDLKYEPKAALTDFADGLSHYKAIISQAQNYLNKGGYLIFEHGFEQKEAIHEIFLQYGFSEISTALDYANLERITWAKFEKFE